MIFVWCHRDKRKTLPDGACNNIQHIQSTGSSDSVTHKISPLDPVSVQMFLNQTSVFVRVNTELLVRETTPGKKVDFLPLPQLGQ